MTKGGWNSQLSRILDPHFHDFSFFRKKCQLEARAGGHSTFLIGLHFLRKNEGGRPYCTCHPPVFGNGKESRYSRSFQAQPRRVLYSSAQGSGPFIGLGGMPRGQARREIQGKSPAAARWIGISASFGGKKANPLSADPISPMLMSIAPFWPAPPKGFLKTGGWQAILYY